VCCTVRSRTGWSSSAACVTPPPSGSARPARCRPGAASGTPLPTARSLRSGGRANPGNFPHGGIAHAINVPGQETQGGGSPALFLTDRETYVVQGWKVAGQRPTVIEIPAAHRECGHGSGHARSNGYSRTRILRGSWANAKGHRRCGCCRGQRLTTYSANSNTRHSISRLPPTISGLSIASVSSSPYSRRTGPFREGRDNRPSDCRTMRSSARSALVRCHPARRLCE
jgi:hypothetical protein